MNKIAREAGCDPLLGQIFFERALPGAYALRATTPGYFQCLLRRQKQEKSRRLAFTAVLLARSEMERHLQAEGGMWYWPETPLKMGFQRMPS